jgi:predicted dinucleotide-binding enzyme
MTACAVEKLTKISAYTATAGYMMSGVKAVNTVFAQHMRTGVVNGHQLTAFAAGDNEAARNTVLELTRAIGFIP